MEIQAILTGISDILSVSKNTLIINGIEYQKDSFPVKPTVKIDSEGNIQNQEEIDNFKAAGYQAFIENGIEKIILSVDIRRNGMFLKTAFINKGEKLYGSNLLRFFDVNNDSDISWEELITISTFYNMTTEKEYKAALKKIRDQWFSDNGYRDKDGKEVPAGILAWKMKGVKA